MTNRTTPQWEYDGLTVIDDQILIEILPLVDDVDAKTIERMKSSNFAMVKDNEIEQSLKRKDLGQTEGIIRAIGVYAYRDESGSLVEPHPVIGNKVLFTRYQGGQINYDGRDPLKKSYYRIMQDRAVLAIKDRDIIHE